MSHHRPRPGDELLISRVDDLAGSLEALAARLRRLEDQGVILRFRDEMGLMTVGEAQALVHGILLAADFHARLTAERLKTEVVEARQKGLFPSGRPRTLDPEQVAELRAAGLGATAIAQRLGVARASVYRKLKEIEAPETRRLKPPKTRGVKPQAASPNCRAARRA